MGPALWAANVSRQLANTLSNHPLQPFPSLGVMASRVKDIIYQCEKQQSNGILPDVNINLHNGYSRMH